MDNELMLTEQEAQLVVLMVAKFDIINQIAQRGIALNITTENFGFPKYTDDEIQTIIKKLYAMEQLAWLKEQKGN